MTDANVVLGRIVPERFLGGRMTLDVERSVEAVGTIARQAGVGVEAAARSIVEVVNANMEHAIRIVSVRRGHDPREHTLVSFGGAGGLHACALADAIGTARVLVPRNPGVLSAFGATASDVVREYGRTVLRPLTSGAMPALSSALAELGRQAEREMGDEGFRPEALVANRTADLRYAGQSYELSVPFADDPEALGRAFHAAHEQRYGYAAPCEPLEVVTVRLRVAGRVETPAPEPIGAGSQAEKSIPARRQGLAVVDREALGEDARFEGPVLLVEPYATTFVPQGWTGRIDRWGHLHLER